MLKTLTTHLVQLQRVIGYSNEQYNQVSDGLLTLLSHSDADYRLIAATILADLGKETKSVDIALLNSFLNDPRVCFSFFFYNYLFCKDLFKNRFWFELNAVIH